MKVIVITGCSSGMGASTAEYLAKYTDTLVIGIARRKEMLIQLEKEISTVEPVGKFIPLVFDISENDHFDDLVSEIKKHAPLISGLINNAGVLLKKPFKEITPEDFGLIMQTNFKSPFFLIQSLLPMFEPHSHIVNIASMGGVQGSVKFADMSIYSASKAALVNLTECLSVELAHKKISVNCIAPGAVQTEMLEKAFPGYQAPVTPGEMGEYIGSFVLTGHHFFNGKVLPLSVSTP
jgi:NAD(P)-dependent dehydrogenase (short-subunit alcohol dehydrogenase family)